jgi:hypothetical protein
LDYRTIDRETGTSEFAAARSGNEAILYESQDLELFADLPSITFGNGVLSPFEQLGIPRWAVIESKCRDSSYNIVWPESIGQISR